jgi:hypothetical protein
MGEVCSTVEMTCIQHLSETSVEKRLLGRPRHKWEDSIKLGIKTLKK